MNYLVKQERSVCSQKNIAYITACTDDFLTGCKKSTDAALSGVLDHSHRMSFPVGTIMTIQIVDTTKAGSTGKNISEQVIKDQEIGIPTPFMIVYDRDKINEDHTYILKVRFEDSSGKLLYTNKLEMPVITQGNPTHDIDVYVDLVDG